MRGILRLTPLAVAVVAVLWAGAPRQGSAQGRPPLGRPEVGRTQRGTGAQPTSRAPIRIQNIKVERDVLTDIGSNSGSDPWLHIRVEYDAFPRWINELDVTYYALFAGTNEETRETETRLCKGTVNTVNVKQGRGRKSSMFMHPDAVERFGKLEYVAVIFEIGGRPVAAMSQPETEAKWWERFSPIEGMFFNRYQLPVYDGEDYSAVKLGSP